MGNRARLGRLPVRPAVRIGLIAYGPLSQVSGGYRYDRQLISCLEHAGHRIEVISLPTRSYLGALLDSFRPGFVDRLAQIRTDVLLEDELCHPSLAWLGRRSGANRLPPRVALVHHLRHLEARPWPLPALSRFVEGHYLRSVDGVVCNSLATRQSVEQAVGRPLTAAVAYPGRDHLVPDIDRADIQRRARRGGRLRVLFVGSLTRRKRPGLLLDALRRLPAGTWQLDMVGAADVEPATYRSLTRRIHRDRRLAEAVQLHGAVSEEDLVVHYRQSDVLCVPSQLEGFGIVYLEAMGFGLPVLAAGHGGAGELVTPGVQGQLIDGRDPDALAGYLARYSRDRELLLAHSLAARARWEQHPRWRDTANATAAYLAEVVGRV